MMTRNGCCERTMYPQRTSEEHANNILLLREKYLNDKFEDDDVNKKRIEIDVIFR